MDDNELDPAELGTHTYWQQNYINEIRNFDENGDPGDVWFGEDSAFRVVDWLCRNVEDKNTAIVDLGCGNGYTLSELAREGFTNLLGIDYCAEAVTLAEKVSKREFPVIEFKVLDVTQDDLAALGPFGVIHDKGTYDVVSLDPEGPKGRREKYIEHVASALSDDGIFVITSCNWTEEELTKQFSEKLKLKHVIPTPQYNFGGKVGGMMSSVVYVKK